MCADRIGVVHADAAGEISRCHVADVVAVSLEPAHHRVFAAEHEAARVAVAARVERPVVAERRRAARPARHAGSALVEAVAAVLVIGLPRRIGRLHDQVRRARVVPHDEEDMAGAAVGVGSRTALAK